jgi:hypothetical protein
MEQVAYPRAERQRQLQQLSFSPSSILSRDLPRDTVLKYLQLRLSGAVQTTFASGTPVADYAGAFDNLIPRVDVIVEGSRVIKSVKPHLMNLQQLITTNTRAERASSAAAAAATDNYPTADAVPQYGTTTQYTTVRETVIISFENSFCNFGQGREHTWLNLKGRSSAEIKLTTNAYSSLLGFGNTAPVTYANSTLVVDIFTMEAQDVPPDIVFADWKQTTKQVTYSAQQTGAIIDINRGNFLQSIVMFTRNGAAGSATTATGKVPSNLVVTNVQLLLNGQLSVKTTDFKALHAEVRARYGVNAPYASDVSQLDGYARLDFLRSKDISTALDVRPPAVDNVQLVLNTNTASNTSYTNPVTIDIMTEEIVEPR